MNKKVMDTWATVAPLLSLCHPGQGEPHRWHHASRVPRMIMPHQGIPPFGISGPHWKKKSCLVPHVKYTNTDENWWAKKKSFKYIYDFVLGHMHSHPGLQVAPGALGGTPLIYPKDSLSFVKPLDSFQAVEPLSCLLLYCFCKCMCFLSLKLYWRFLNEGFLEHLHFPFACRRNRTSVPCDRILSLMPFFKTKYSHEKRGNLWVTSMGIKSVHSQWRQSLYIAMNKNSIIFKKGGPKNSSGEGSQNGTLTGWILNITHLVETHGLSLSFGTEVITSYKETGLSD